MKNNLNLNSEVSDLLVNSDFLRLVRTFINIYGINELLIDNKLSDFFDKLNTFRDKNEDLEKIFTKSELLDELGFIFSHEEILASFLEYIKDTNIDKKLLSVYLEIANYLINIYNNKDKYPENLDVESIRLKDKVGDILGKGELDNVSLLITKNDFPTIGKKGFPIVKIDFDNVVDFYGDGDKEFLFVKVEDTEGNIFYHNYKGDIFLTNDGREIINVEYIYSFQGYSVLKVKSNDLHTSLEIRSKDGETFDMPEGLGDILPGKLVDGDNELEYLILSKTRDGITKTSLFNIDGDTVNLMDILKFINKGKESTVKMLELSLSKFEDINISGIKGIKTIGGVKFVELSLDLYDDEYSEEEHESFDIIMMESGKPLSDDNGEYIKHLFEIESFGGKELLGFGFTPFSIDGFIGSTGNVLTINDELIHTIDDTKMSFKGMEMFKINDNNDFIVKESKIKKSLDKLLGFNEIILEEIEEDGFNLVFEDKDNFFIKERKIDQLSCSSENGKLNILLYSNGVGESIEYMDLITELNKEEKYKAILKQINILINTSL